MNLILWTYTIEAFVYSTLNEALRDGDVSKVDTLGPFSFALGRILMDAPFWRTDNSVRNELYDKKALVLYRGTA